MGSKVASRICCVWIRILLGEGNMQYYGTKFALEPN